MPIRLRDLSQGALLHVVCALLAGPMKADQIVRRTGKSPESVQRALAVLDHELHLVTSVPDGRWPVWSLRDTSQLLLDLTPQISESGGGGGSNNTQTLLSNILLLPVTPQISESDALPEHNPPQSVEGNLLVNQLTSLGCTPKRAAKAINAALKRGEKPATISQRISHLTAYIRTQHLRQPGEWTAQFIEAGSALPQLPAPKEDYSGYRPYLATNDEEES